MFRKQPITYSNVHACGFIVDSDEDFPRKSFKPKKNSFAENSVYSLYNETSKHSLAENCVYSLYNDTSTEHFKEQNQNSIYYDQHKEQPTQDGKIK